MGDRADIYVHEGRRKGVYLYTHWSAEELPGILRKALKRGESRWSDTPYLTRIVFSEMIQGNVMAETGYGISTEKCGDRVIDVNVTSQMVTDYNGVTRSFTSFTRDRLD